MLPFRRTVRRLAVLGAAVALALPLIPGAANAASARPYTKIPFAVGGYLEPTQRVSAASIMYPHDSLPASVDLSAYLPAVGNQGQVASCVAWTIAHSIMGYYAARTSGTGAPYAPLYLYLRAVAKGGAPNAGLYPNQALTEAQANGVDTQDDYFQGTTAYQTAPTPAEIANARNYRITGWTTLWTGANQGAAAQTAIKQALAAGNPVAIGMPVFMDFENLNSAQLYSTLTGQSLGGHMVTVYKYDADGVWIRNQWSTLWGAHGDAHLSWSFVTTDVNAAYTVSGVATAGSTVTAPPTVSVVSPNKAAAGTTVILVGGGLAAATGVNFGGVPAAFTSRVTDGGATQLIATVPAQSTTTATTVDVTVTNPGGTSAVSSADKFTYVPPPPAVTGLDTATVSTLGGATVTVTGTALGGATAVRVGNAAAPTIRSLSDSTVQFTAPALPVGTYDVKVTTRNGTSAVVPADQLGYALPPAPAVTSLSPSSGLTYRTTVVTLTGTYLGGTSRVTIGGVAATYSRINDTQLKVTLPPHAAGRLDVQVTAAGGTSAAGTTFNYLAPPAPTVTAVAPAVGAAARSTAVVITGTDVIGATQVTLAGQPVPFTRINDTQLRVTLPARVAGVVDLQVTTPSGMSTVVSADQFRYV